MQGVGFRPFVYRHAVALGLAGSVRNDSDGRADRRRGRRRPASPSWRGSSSTTPPPLARVASVTVASRSRADGAPRRLPRSSRATRRARRRRRSASTPPTCDDCLAEVDDPGDRRYRYPFTNCTNCGPRYTIVLPRARTTGRPRPWPASRCARACQAEYDDPADRRFHAQPNACPDVRAAAGLARRATARCSVPTATTRWTPPSPRSRAGAIVAVKGIGGYHLAVDATDEDAVAELRRRKARDDKPFAVMVADVAAADAVVRARRPRRAALLDVAAPADRARARDAPTATVAAAVAPGLARARGVPALHAAPPPPAARRRPAAGDDERQPQRRADRPRRRRRRRPPRARWSTASSPTTARSTSAATTRWCGRPGAGCRCCAARAATRPSRCRCPSRAAAPVLAVGAELKSTIAVTEGTTVVRQPPHRRPRAPRHLPVVPPGASTTCPRSTA